MDYPIIIDFDMRKARLLRGALYLALVSLVGIVAWALLTGQGRFETVGAFIGFLLFMPVFFSYNFYMLQPRFKARHALEIHRDHLVWATTRGPRLIPRHAARAVVGGDRLQRSGVVWRVELEVTPEYRVPTLLGSRENPSLQQEFANGHTEVSVSIVLENWLRDRP